MNRPKKSKPAETKKTTKAGEKKPLNKRDDPLARDTRGKATREDVRKVSSPTNAPRSTRRGS